MLKIKGIAHVVGEEMYYLIITSNKKGIACKIRPQDASLIFQNTLYKEKRTDPKTRIKEYEFITEKSKKTRPNINL